MALTKPAQSPKNIILAIVPLLFTLVGLAYLAEHSELLRPKTALDSRDSIPGELVTSGRMLGILRDLKVIEPQASRDVLHAIKNNQHHEHSLIDGTGGALHYAGRQAADGEDPLLPKSEIEKPAYVVSIIAAPEDLDGTKRGIIHNRFERGRKWERPAFVSFYDNGKLVFRSGVGLRASGGKSRFYKELLSFRLYFRNQYGKRHLPSSLIFDQPVGNLRTLLLQSDRRRGIRDKSDTYQFVNPLGYDLMRQAGGYVSQTKPVKFFLNGQLRGVFVATERQDRHFLRNHFGHEDFVLVQRNDVGNGGSAVKLGDPQIHADFVEWVYGRSRFTLESVNKKVDLKNLVDWFVMQTYFGNTDIFQPSLVLNLRESNPRWFWIGYDVDHSFRDLYRARKEFWRNNAVPGFLTHKRAKRRFVEAKIIGKLFKDDPRFAAYVRDAASRILNHVLTPDYLNERVNYYESITKQYEMKYSSFIPKLRTFFKHRAEVYRRQLQHNFRLGEIHPVAIEGPAGVSFHVDGYQKSERYEGYHFAGEKLRITTSSPGIFVNGEPRKVTNGQVILPVTANMAVRME